MSTLKLENIKHENSSTNNMVMDSDGSVSTTGNATVGGTLGVTGALTVDTETSGLPSVNLKHSNSGADNFQLVSGTPGVANSGFSIRDIDAAANRLVINSAGKVGIGTSTPAKPLSVNLAGGGDFIAEFQNTTDATPYGIHVKDAASGANGYPLLQVTNGAGSQAYFRVDSGTGYVTMPKQPAFSYLGSKSYVIGGTGTTVMSSSNVWASNVNHAFNRGSHFNASNGRFTAPVAGTYAFNFKCQASNFGSGYLWFYFNINGGTKSYAQKSQEAAHTFINHYMIAELAASDYVDASWTNNYVSGQIHYPGFSGHLIG